MLPGYSKRIANGPQGIAKELTRIFSQQILGCESIGHTPLQNTRPFLGVGGLERHGAPVIKIKMSLVTKKENENDPGEKQRKAPLLL